jgi:hypothetical protein
MSAQDNDGSTISFYNKSNWKHVSVYMDNVEIDLNSLKAAVNAVLDHLIEDLSLEKVAIEELEDFYWTCPPRERYDTSKKPSEWWTGRLSDDVSFIRLVQRGQSADISYNLVHIAPLLRYIAEKIQK